MNEVVLNGGEPVLVEMDDGPIGAGPWARLVASSIVPDEGSARAERGRELAWAGMVSDVTVTEGVVRASVQGSLDSPYLVALETSTLAPRVWKEAVRAARERRALTPGIEGASQSVHLVHFLETEQREPLIPPARRIRTACTCPDHDRTSVCKHVAALAFVLADAIDGDPSLLLRWRGCEPVAPPASRGGDPWLAGPLPPPRRLRSLPPGAVIKRLGRSGIRVGGRDLAEALEPAYRAFARSSPEASRPGMIDAWSSDSVS